MIMGEYSTVTMITELFFSQNFLIIQKTTETIVSRVTSIPFVKNTLLALGRCTGHS